MPNHRYCRQDVKECIRLEECMLTLCLEYSVLPSSVQEVVCVGMNMYERKLIFCFKLVWQLVSLF